VASLIDNFPALERLLLKRRRKIIPVIRQLAATDCGPASLAMVLGYFGKNVPLDDVRRRMGISRDGVTATSLLNTGRSYGLSARAVQLEPENVANIPPGAILYWEFNHFVVLEKSGLKTIKIVDPAFGRRSISVKQFSTSFTGVALIFEPGEIFTAHKEGKDHQLTSLFGQIFQRRDLIARIIFASLFVQSLAAIVPLLLAIVVDRVIPHSDLSLLIVLAGAYCTFQIFSVISGYIRTQLLIHLRTDLEARFTLRFLDHLINLPYSFFQQHTSGDLMVRLGSNSTIRDMLTSSALSAMLDGTMAALYLLLLLIASVPLTLVALGLAFIRFVLLATVRWRQRRLIVETLENQARSQTFQVEMISGIETLKAMGLEQRSAETWSHLFVEGLNIAVRQGQLDALFEGCLNFLSTATTLVFLFYGAALVLRGTLSLGLMLAFSAIAAGFLGPLNSLVSAVLQMQTVEIYIERVNDVFRTAPEQTPGVFPPIGALKGNIAVENLTFRYSTESPCVVNEVSVSFDIGSRVALVGRSGSGKSTFAKLLAGLYEPTSGRVTLDGHDLRTVNLRSVRSQFGIVTQDTHLFAGSIRSNISLSNPDMSLDQVVRSAKLASIHDDIIAMPMGYETVIHDRGLSLSGGQRQRLAIARAIASGPRILILDEATSHLDSMTEHLVANNLSSLRCTQVIVAHRLSTIMQAELILVMDEGQIVEQGNHGSLLAAGGIYASLVQAQRESRQVELA
jgi:ATP-binding cassette, subfamily B, bacterial